MTCFNGPIVSSSESAVVGTSAMDSSLPSRGYAGLHVTVTVTRMTGVKKSLLGLDSWIAAAEEVSLHVC